MTNDIKLNDLFKVEISQKAIHSVFSKLSKKEYSILGRSFLVWLLMESNKSKGYQKDYALRVSIIPLLMTYFGLPLLAFSHLYGTIGTISSVSLCTIMAIITLFRTRSLLLKEVIDNTHKKNLEIAVRAWTDKEINLTGTEQPFGNELSVIQEHLDGKKVKASQLKNSMVKLIESLDSAQERLSHEKIQ